MCILGVMNEYRNAVRHGIKLYLPKFQIFVLVYKKRFYKNRLSQIIYNGTALAKFNNIC